MKLKFTRVRTVLAVLCVGALAVGCGSSPTDTGGGSATGSGRGATGLAAVYAALDGLTGDARYEKLLELAKKEGGTVSFYHSGDMTVENKAFTAKTGLKVADFQATSERVAERVSQEKKAGRQGSDLVLGGATDVATLQAEGGIAKLDSPVSETVSDLYKSTDLVSPIAIMMMPTHNTNTVKDSDLPKSWTDYFTTFTKRKAIELTDWEWYYTIVTKYFMAQKGMTEQQAIDLITKGMKGAFTVDGHTLTGQLLASGQYDYVPNMFAHYVPGLIKKGAPISYDGASKDLPPSVVLLYIGLTDGGPHPASALLYLEWMMSSDGQDAVASTDYVPTATTYTGESLLKDYPYALVVDTPKQSADVLDKWKKAFDTLLRAADTKQTK
jgi:hypothetical protein